MSKVCEVTGKGPISAHKVSHSNIKTKTRKLPSLQFRRFWIPEEKRWVRLRVSSRGIRTIQKRGISAVWAEIKTQRAAV